MSMSKQNAKRFALEKNVASNTKEKEKSGSNFLAKHMKKVYPIAFYKSRSPLSLSSLSLTLSHNSNDSSYTEWSMPLDDKIALALHLIESSKRIEYFPVVKNVPKPCLVVPNIINATVEECSRRCNWITKTSDKLYVDFHDECWGVPVYDDNELFELLALSGMLMDFNWTEILRRKHQLRHAFGGFDANHVAKMGEKEIIDIASDKALMISETRVRCIIDNSKCILKIAREFGSFSSFMWNYVNYKPVINRNKHPGKVPLRSPKAEAISKDLLKRGFRFVGPVIVYSFMQAAGFTNDHLVDCFRYIQLCSNTLEPPTHPCQIN